MTDERINTGYAALKTDSNDVPIQVSGIALGDGDITNGDTGKATLWPGDVLKEAPLRGSDEALEGQPIANDQNHTTDGTQAQTPSDAIRGGVDWAGYKDGVGVLYEGEVDDPNIARSVENDRLEVSPLVSREIEPLEGELKEKYEEQGYDVEAAEYVATKIHAWRDIATVQNGAAPSNEITVGENPMKAEALHAQVESLQEDLTPPEQAQTNAQKVLDWREEHGDEVDAMTETGWNRAQQLAEGGELSPEVVKKMAQFNRHRGNSGVSDEYEGEPWKDNGHVAWLGWGGDAGVDWAINKSENLNESMASAHESDSGTETHEALKEVAGVEFDGTTTGKLDESEIPTDGFEAHYLYPGENKSESSYPVVDADGNLRKGNVDSAWQLGARGDADEDTHDSRLMDLANEFEDPPEWANNGESMGSGVEYPTHWEACSVTFPVEMLNDDGAHELSPQSSVDDDSKTMTEEDTLTDDEKAILEVAEGVEDATDALNAYADHEDPEVVEATEYEALNSRVDTLKDMMSERIIEETGLKESTVESMSFEAMAKEFETEEGDFDAEALVQKPESGEPEADESGVESLSEDADMDKAEALYNDYQTFGTEGLKQDITEALGVSDFDDAIEVLD